MRYLLFYNFLDAEARNNAAYNQGKASGAFAPETLYYSTVKKNPYRDEFALLVEEKYADLFTAEENAAAVELGKDWFNSGKIEGNYIIEQPINADQRDPTINKVAFCNLPEVQKHLYKTFVLEVIVRSYRNGEHIWEERPDRKIDLTANNDDGEFDQFYAWVDQGANPFALTRQYIGIRDQDGRFN